MYEMFFVPWKSIQTADSLDFPSHQHELKNVFTDKSKGNIER